MCGARASARPCYPEPSLCCSPIVGGSVQGQISSCATTQHTCSRCPEYTRLQDSELVNRYLASVRNRTSLVTRRLATRPLTKRLITTRSSFQSPTHERRVVVYRRCRVIGAPVTQEMDQVTPASLTHLDHVRKNCSFPGIPVRPANGPQRTGARVVGP